MINYIKLIEICPKWQEADKKISELILICPKWQKYVNFMSIFCSLSRLDSDMFCQFDQCFLVVHGPNFEWAQCECIMGLQGMIYTHHIKVFCMVHSKLTEGHSTHETESPWPLHFKHSHWWERRSRSKFSSHYPWGTNGVCECKMDVKSTWIPTRHRLDCVS